jgi:hypothetical protein
MPRPLDLRNYGVANFQELARIVGTLVFGRHLISGPQGLPRCAIAASSKDERIRNNREALAMLGRRIARWVEDNRHRIDAEPKLPEEGSTSQVLPATTGRCLSP